MNDKHYIRHDLKCEHGPVGPAYKIGKRCIACGVQSAVAGKNKRRTRDPAKSRKYYKTWYKKNAHHYNAGRVSVYALAHQSTFAARSAKLHRETRALLEMSANVRREISRRRTPERKLASRLHAYARRKAGGSLDWTIEDLIGWINVAVEAGSVTWTRGQPKSASLDQSIAGLGYHRANVQVVPLWWNFAKHLWNPDDVETAIRAWMERR